MNKKTIIKCKTCGEYKTKESNYHVCKIKLNPKVKLNE